MVLAQRGPRPDAGEDFHSRTLRDLPRRTARPGQRKVIVGNGAYIQPTGVRRARWHRHRRNAHGDVRTGAGLVLGAGHEVGLRRTCRGRWGAREGRRASSAGTSARADDVQNADAPPPASDHRRPLGQPKNDRTRVIRPSANRDRSPLRVVPSGPSRSRSLLRRPNSPPAGILSSPKSGAGERSVSVDRGSDCVGWLVMWDRQSGAANHSNCSMSVRTSCDRDHHG